MEWSHHHPSPLQVDLASEAELAGVEAALRRINAAVAVVRCERCAVDLALLLDTGIYTGGQAAAERSALLGGGAAGPEDDGEGQGGAAPGGAAAECPADCSRPHQHHHHGSSHSHGDQIATESAVLEGSLDLRRLRHWLDELLWEGGAAAGGGGGVAHDGGRRRPEILRAKGLLSVAGSGRKHVVQAVHEMYDVVEGRPWAPGEARYCKIVFIGRHLDGAALRRGLSACAVASPP